MERQACVGVDESHADGQRVHDDTGREQDGGGPTFRFREPLVE